MAKGNIHPADSDLLAGDWFLPAITCDGSVGDSLGSVLDELERKSAFARGLRQNLTAAGSAIDRVTLLVQRIKLLETTLRFRLGILLPERPQAWFRAPATTSTGPFQATLIGEPVFAAYAAADVDMLQQGLETAWLERRCTGLPFAGNGASLWTTLLELNARLEEVVCLPAPFATLRLDEMPATLPPDLASRALNAFLLNVRNEIVAAQERLTACYSQLHETSAKLWHLQREQLKAPRSGARHQAAEELRAEFRRRRNVTPRPLLSAADARALEFMGFDELPPAEVLRQRYLQLARKLHPDLQGGSDLGFKTLASAYAQLSSRLDKGQGI
jgi:hypothetical protein